MRVFYWVDESEQSRLYFIVLNNRLWNYDGLVRMALSLAEFIKQLLEDEDGACRAENNERLTAKHAEYRSCKSSAQKALHHTLTRRETRKQGEKERDKKEKGYRWS